MKRILTALLLLTATHVFAERIVTTITPDVGLTIGLTHVLVRGSELVSEFVHCQDSCQNPNPCPVTVWFGDTQAKVLFALPEYIVLEVPPRAAGSVDVTVRVAGREDIVVTNGFRFDPNAVVGAGDYDRFLVPVLGHETPGAHGSLWTTELTVHNAASSRVVIRAPSCDPMLPIATCPDTPIEPDTTMALRLYGTGWGSAGAFLYVPKAVSAVVPMELRVRDLSRAGEGWGTEIPVVRPTDFYPAQRLLDVPTDSRYRATLRIYAYSEYPLPVKVRVLPPDGDEAIEEIELELAGIIPIVPSEFPLNPSYAQIDPLTAAVRNSGNQSVRVEVLNDDDSIASPPMSLWAFISITNNDTQQVTAITPHR